MHSRNESVVNGIERCDAHGDRLLRQISGRVGRTVNNALPHGVKSVVWHEFLRTMLAHKSQARL